MTRPADGQRTDPTGPTGPGSSQALDPRTGPRTRPPTHEKAGGGGAPMRGRGRAIITVNPPIPTYEICNNHRRLVDVSNRMR